MAEQNNHQKDNSIQQLTHGVNKLTQEVEKQQQSIDKLMNTSNSDKKLSVVEQDQKGFWIFMICVIIGISAFGCCVALKCF